MFIKEFARCEKIPIRRNFWNTFLESVRTELKCSSAQILKSNAKAIELFSKKSCQLILKFWSCVHYLNCSDREVFLERLIRKGEIECVIITKNQEQFNPKCFVPESQWIFYPNTRPKKVILCDWDCIDR